MHYICTAKKIKQETTIWFDIINWHIDIYNVTIVYVAGVFMAAMWKVSESTWRVFLCKVYVANSVYMISIYVTSDNMPMWQISIRQLVSTTNVYGQNFMFMLQIFMWKVSMWQLSMW